MSDLDKTGTDIKVPILTKACDRFGLSCSYCEQGAPHPSPKESDWSSKDWDGTKAKTKEKTNSLTDYNAPKPLNDIDQRTAINEIPFSKLQIRQNDPKEELVEITDSLILPPMTKALEDTVEKNDSDKLSEVERKQQQEEENTKYIRGHRWESSVKWRRVTQSQTTQATVTLPEDKNICEL